MKGNTFPRVLSEKETLLFSYILLPSQRKILHTYIIDLPLNLFDAQRGDFFSGIRDLVLVELEIFQVGHITKSCGELCDVNVICDVQRLQVLQVLHRRRKCTQLVVSINTNKLNCNERDKLGTNNRAYEWRTEFGPPPLLPGGHFQLNIRHIRPAVIEI